MNSKFNFKPQQNSGFNSNFSSPSFEKGSAMQNSFSKMFGESQPSMKDLERSSMRLSAYETAQKKKLMREEERLKNNNRNIINTDNL
jgi:hypothetical protein